MIRHTLTHKKLDFVVTEYGKSGKILFLLPGWNHDFNNDPKFIKELSKYFHIFTLTYPGYNGIKADKRSQSMRFLSELVNKSLSELSIKKPTFIALSFGTQVFTHFQNLYLKHDNAILFGAPILNQRKKAPKLIQPILRFPFVFQIFRYSKRIKNKLVSLANHKVQNLTEVKISNFTERYSSLNGAYDTMVAFACNFVTPVDSSNHVKYAYGENDPLLKDAVQTKIDSIIVKNAGHYFFEPRYKESVELIVDLSKQISNA